MAVTTRVTAMLGIEQITRRIGATVTGIDLSRPLDRPVVDAIRAALDEHAVLAFPDQKLLSDEENLRFVRSFGAIHVPEFRTPASTRDDVTILDQDNPKGQGADEWHADSTFLEAPPRAGTLQPHLLPAVGGDTCFASMYAAYDALTPSVKAFLEPLTASHSASRMLERTRVRAGYATSERNDTKPPVHHPVITVNPATGRRMLYVNSVWTLAIDGLARAESDYWLAFLCDHIKSPEHQMRHRWRIRDLILFDEPATQHYAVADYDSRRVMQRVLMEGERPVGVGEVEGCSQTSKAQAGC